MTVDAEWEKTLFNLILHAGEARSKAKEAAEAARQGDWDEARALMEGAQAEQLEAHKVNAGIIRQEAKGQSPQFSVLLVHAMDLLLLAWSELDYTEQYVDTCKRLHALESEMAAWRSQRSGS
jgi:PTS system cellobiose-specific IIA component